MNHSITVFHSVARGSWTVSIRQQQSCRSSCQNLTNYNINKNNDVYQLFTTKRIKLTITKYFSFEIKCFVQGIMYIKV